MNIVEQGIKLSVDPYPQRKGFVAFKVESYDGQAVFGRHSLLPPMALAMCNDLDTTAAQALTSGIPWVLVHFEGTQNYRVSPAAIVEFTRQLKKVATAKFGERPEVRITSNTKASHALRSLLEAINNATGPGEWADHWRVRAREALEDAEKEQQNWPLMLRILADEAYRNGVAVGAGRETCGQFKATGDVEVLIARAVAQVKP